MMFGDVGDVRVVDRVAAPIAGLPRLGSDGSMMKRHDSQHSARLVGDVRSVDRFPPACDGSLLGDSAGMGMKRNDDSQRGDRLAPQDRRPRRRPEGPRSGWPIQPVRSDLVGEADKLLAATQPARPILAYPPCTRSGSPHRGRLRLQHRGSGRLRVAPAQSTASPTPTHRRRTNRRRCRSITSITTLPVFPGAQEVHMVLKEPHVRAA